jgi:putative holliday junction resolvase
MFDLLGIDWGMSKIGIALGSTLTGLIIPINDLATNQNIVQIIRSKIKDHSTISTLIVGKPLSMQLEKTNITIKVESFVEKMKLVFPEMIVKTVLERGTTKSAMESIIKLKQSKQFKGKTYLDDTLSAMEILKIYLNH